MIIADVVNDFHRDGFVIVRGALPVAFVDNLRAKVARFIDERAAAMSDTERYSEDGESGAVKALHGMERYDAAFDALRGDERLLGIVSAIWPGETMTAGSVSFFAKPARVGGAVPAHQDNGFHHWKPPHVLELTIALDASTPDNGALICQAGSHKRGVLPHRPSGLMGFSRVLAEPLDTARYPEVALCMKPGDVALHHFDTVHRSDANRSEHPRGQIGITYRSSAAAQDAAEKARYERDLASLHARRPEYTMPSHLIKQQEVSIYEHADAYVHNPVVERVGDELWCVFREAKRRRHRTHIDLSSHASLVRSRDGGKTWGAHAVLFDREGWGVQDPSIRRLRDGTLIVNFFVWVVGSDADVPLDHAYVHTSDAAHYSWVLGTFTIRSTDGGATWSEPAPVPSLTGLCTTTSDPVIELEGGDLLIPLEGCRAGEKPRAMVARSADGGVTWGEPVTAAFDPLGHVSFHESSLLSLGGGRVLAMHRTHEVGEREYGGYLHQSESTDAGRTWSPPRRTNVWGHPAHLLRLQSGAILLAYGHRRAPFGVHACLSHDDGATWDVAGACVLRSDGIDGDVGYPTSIQLADGTIFTSWYMTRRDGAAASADSFFAYASPQAYLAGTFLRET